MAFRFLDLPSELRNRIYEIAAAASDEPRAISWRPHGAHGKHAGLTRVCVQIRAEYRPIQRRKAKVSVGFSDLNVFTRTFLTSAADKMILPLEVHVRVSPTQPGLALTFDSLPILKVKVQNPRLDIRIVPTTIPKGAQFRGGGPHNAAALATIALNQAQDLNSLLLHSNENWHALLRNGSIGEVYVGMEIGFTRVDIVFVGTLGYRERPRIFRNDEEWRISHGLQDPASRNHVIHFSFLHKEWY